MATRMIVKLCESLYPLVYYLCVLNEIIFVQPFCLLQTLFLIQLCTYMSNVLFLIHLTTVNAYLVVDTLFLCPSQDTCYVC